MRQPNSKTISFGQCRVLVCCIVHDGLRESRDPKTLKPYIRYGNGTLVDGMVHDGLWDAYGNFHMGVAAEKCAHDYNITRADQVMGPSIYG